MSWQIAIAPAFDADLIAIERYLTQHASASVARRQVMRIRDKIPIIAENPLAFPTRPLLGDGIRVAIARPYGSIFWTRFDPVGLLRVVHGARDLPALRLPNA
jgi:toxin ParE1/3/4